MIRSTSLAWSMDRKRDYGMFPGGEAGFRFLGPLARLR
jgi:hypothetical protein